MGEHFFCNRMSVLLLVLMAVAVSAQAVVEIETVPVGSPGNAGEISGYGLGDSGNVRVCGTVYYAYDIGKFEVTAGQYTEFLNAVAAEDPYELYSEWMTNISNYNGGCNIIRNGSPGGYTYSVSADWRERPVNNVNYGSAARFANWLHNGQPTGPQDTTTTEDGSYYLNGAMSDTELLSLTRQPGATWVIPSEDEWYKAAYYDAGSSLYYDYPTGTDVRPNNDVTVPDGGNSANFAGTNDPTIGLPYLRTEVGEFENSPSPFGTFDQGGNVWEWNEGVVSETERGLRGGGFNFFHDRMLATTRSSLRVPASNFSSYIGFRVALVPEPATLSLLGLGGLAMLRRRKNK